MNKGQSTLHTKHNLEKKTPFHPPTHQKNKMEAPPLDDVPCHWLHGNSIHKIGCHYILLGLIALFKNTLLIETKSKKFDQQF
jgi:hypothetical protein